jgi:hypothetical protein
MNVKLAMALGAVVVAASTSFAHASEYVDFSNFISTKSRAEVISEQAAARADGTTLNVLDGVYPVITRQADVPRSRQEVVAELAQFRGEHPNFNGELDYPAIFQPAPTQQRVASMETPSTAK